MKLSPELQEDLESWREAIDPTTKKFCAECGEECKTGQPMWNGWFIYEDLYHLDCMPEKYKKQFGIK